MHWHHENALNPPLDPVAHGSSRRGGLLFPEGALVRSRLTTRDFAFKSHVNPIRNASVALPTRSGAGKVARTLPSKLQLPGPGGVIVSGGRGVIVHRSGL